MKMDPFQETYGVKLIRGILFPSDLLFNISWFWELASLQVVHILPNLFFFLQVLLYCYMLSLNIASLE